MSAQVEFLFAELGLAKTFLDIADTSLNPATVERNQKKAHMAYDAVLRLLPKCRINPIESVAIQDKLAALKNRLESSS